MNPYRDSYHVNRSNTKTSMMGIKINSNSFFGGCQILPIHEKVSHTRLAVGDIYVRTFLSP